MTIFLSILLLVQFVLVIFISNNVRRMVRNEQVKQFRERIIEAISNSVTREVDLYTEEEVANSKVREYFDRTAEKRIKVLNTVSHSDMVNSFKSIRVSSFYSEEQQKVMFQVETEKKALM